MNNLDELKKYVVQASIEQELIREQTECYQPKPLSEESEIIPPKSGTGETNQIRNINSSNINNAVRQLSEAIVSEMVGTFEGPYNPDEGCPDYIDKTQKLLQLIQDMFWKLRDSYRKSYPGEEDFSDIKEMMITAVKPTLKLAIAKLYDIWMREIDEKPKDSVEASVKIIDVQPGDNVVSPQGQEYSVMNVGENKISLKGLDGKTFMIETKNLSTRWRKK